MAEKQKRQSPYQKYGKRPFSYLHPSCRHAQSHIEQFPARYPDGNVRHIAAKCCNSCNVIVDGPWDTARQNIPQSAA